MIRGTHNTPSSDLEFEEIELTSFPKHLPLRPDKPSLLRKLWRKTSFRIALVALISVIIVICAAITAFFVGKSIQNSRYAKHPDPTPTRVVTPAVTTVQITQTSLATSTVETLVASWQSTEVATATAAPSEKSVESCEACGDGTHDLDVM